MLKLFFKPNRRSVESSHRPTVQRFIHNQQSFPSHVHLQWLNVTSLPRGTQLLLLQVNALTRDGIVQACAPTIFYRVDATRSIADDTRKTDAMLTLGGHRFSFSRSLLQHRNTRMGITTLPSCYMIVSFLLSLVSH